MDNLKLISVRRIPFLEINPPFQIFTDTSLFNFGFLQQVPKGDRTYLLKITIYLTKFIDNRFNTCAFQIDFHLVVEETFGGQLYIGTVSDIYSQAISIASIHYERLFRETIECPSLGNIMQYTIDGHLERPIHNR